MRVFVFNKQDDLVFDFQKIEQLAKIVVDFEGKTYDEVSIYLVTKQEISKLHDEYFSDPTPTDCISFPQEEEKEFTEAYRMMGDVFVCPAIAIEYAQEHALDPYEETALYIVHGLLHLMGYEDQDPKNRFLMKKAESKHMEQLKEQGILPFLPSFDAN